MFLYAESALAPPTYRNHLRYHFEGSKHDVPNGGRVFVEVGECEHEPQTLREEAIRAAKLIRASTAQPLWLCLSGGVDSEVMVRSFIEAEIEFNVAIMRFPKRLNWFDIRSGVQFCDRQGIDFHFFDFDPLEFFARGEHLEIARRYRCRSPQLAVHLELMKRIPGFPVFAGNIPHILPGTPRCVSIPTDHFFCYHRFLLAEQKEGVAFFLNYTPELIYAALRVPTMQRVLREDDGELDYLGKVSALQEGGFPVEPRTGKISGFERIKRHYAGDGDRTTFDRRFRQPMEALFPEPTAHVLGMDESRIWLNRNR